MQDNAAEIFPIVTPDGRVIGRATRGECHGGSMLLHPVVHLHVFNSRGELYLQKRPDWKDIQPGRWDTAVGGHVDFGETIAETLRREAREELGITDFTPVALTPYVFESARERELVHPHITIYDGPITPSAELATGRFWSIEAIEGVIQAHHQSGSRTSVQSVPRQTIFTPNFESEWPAIQAAHSRLCSK